MPNHPTASHKDPTIVKTASVKGGVVTLYSDGSIRAVWDQSGSETWTNIHNLPMNAMRAEFEDMVDRWKR